MQGRAQAVQPRYVGHRVPRPVAIAARYPPLAQRRAQYKAAMSQVRRVRSDRVGMGRAGT